MIRFMIFFFFMLISLVALSQANVYDKLPQHGALLDGKTIVKTNVLGLPLRNFSFYGERILTKRLSAGIGINTMPNGQIPLISKFTDEQELLDVRVGTTAITPELRVYLGKSGYGKGFYLAPYYRFEKFNLNNFVLVPEDEDDDEISMRGNLSTHSVGLALGVQWLMGKKKNISLDWSIIGAHYGANKGHLRGEFSETIIQADLDEFRDDIENEVGDFITIKDLRSEGKTAYLDFTSPWAFLRMSLSVGFRF